MKLIPQILVIGLIGVVAVPVSARFVPGTRPWLDQVGWLQPLIEAGVVPAPVDAAALAAQSRPGGPGPPW